MSQKYPVYVEGRVRPVEWCDPQRAAALLSAGKKGNVRPIRARKGGELVGLMIIAKADESRDTDARHDPCGSIPVYSEQVGDRCIPMLKRAVGLGFVAWSDQDGFDPYRFNPDMIPEPLSPSLRCRR